MENAAAGSHPLDITGSHAALVSEAVAMSDFTGEDVGDGLDAAMGVPGKSCDVVFGILVPEVVEQEKWIEFLCFAKPKGALQLDAGSFDGGFGLENLFDCAKRHGVNLLGLTGIGCIKVIFVATSKFDNPQV
jgi:hypothetical protein